MIKNSRGRIVYINPDARVSPKRVLFLESKPDFETSDQFYTDLTDNIAKGGIFVSTYDLKPVGTKAVVKITLPDQPSFGVSGRVAWVREYNGMDPQIPPGMGIGFFALEHQKKEMIESFLDKNPPLLFDNEAVTAAPVAEPNLEEIQRTLALAQTILTDPISLGDEPVDETSLYDNAAEERQFVMGMCRDVGTLPVKEQHVSQPIQTMSFEPPVEFDIPGPFVSLESRPSEDLKSGSNEVIEVHPDVPVDRILARSVPQVSTQFQGGFQASDRGRGVFIASMAPRPRGSELRVRIDLGHTFVSGTGKVQWVRRGNMGIQSAMAPSGMGVVLTELSRHTETQIAGATPRGDSFLNCEEIPSI